MKENPTNQPSETPYVPNELLSVQCKALICLADDRLKNGRDRTVHDDIHQAVVSIQRLTQQLATAIAERDALLLILDNFLLTGRPHTGRSVVYPDGCECELCEHWDKLNKERNKICQ